MTISKLQGKAKDQNGKINTWSKIKTNLDPLDETKLNLKDKSVLKKLF